jgi:hypothetical protein
MRQTSIRFWEYVAISPGHLPALPSENHQEPSKKCESPTSGSQRNVLTFFSPSVFRERDESVLYDFMVLYGREFLNMANNINIGSSDIFAEIMFIVKGCHFRTKKCEARESDAAM